MKQLLAGIVILLVVGIGGFLYKSALEHPADPTATSTAPVACTTDAKLCPDGTAVGRTGPNCQFAACPAPNVELATVRASFALPAGYAANPAALGSDATLVAAYEKPAKAGAQHAIVVRDFPIPAGKTATQVILANTMFESSGALATSMSQFSTKLAGGKSFSCVVLERFEGQVHSACYLPRAGDVLRFEVLEKDVDWTNPKLVVEDLPEHRVFYGMLATVQVQ